MKKQRLAKLTYDDANYAHSRLTGTFISVNGEIVLVDTVTKEGKDIVVYYRKKDNVLTKALLSECDLTPFRYGNANIEGVSGFIYRMPKRNDWRQGARFGQLSVIPTPAYRFNLGMFRDFWDLEPTIKGQYYSLPTCLEMIEDGYNCRAFDRNWSVDRRYHLFYKGNKKVGFVNPDNGALNLDVNYSWLQESLEETMEGH